MTSLDERIAALFRKGTPIFGDVGQPSPLDHPIAEEAASEAVVSEPAGERANATRVDDKPTLASQETVAAQARSPLAELDLDTAIRLRWALRDIKAKRTKLTPGNSSELKTLTEMDLVEMRDDAPTLTNGAHQVRKPVLDLSGNVRRNASSHCLTASQKRIDVTAAQFARSR